MDTAVQMAISVGIIINTFHNLEPIAITAISEGLCVPDAATPPIYCIGPLIDKQETNSEEHPCEIALGLETADGDIGGRNEGRAVARGVWWNKICEWRIEKRVKELMESENGNRIRHRVMELRDAAKAALSDENRSSRVELAKLIMKRKQ
ncbi:hypothetical protein DCAR_0626150 [Daucus carota subsp. sativus]|uniref:Uncharacterized protein n=1 Tax=Daucus carota subsp. sativus TaxID=79200 RepID=A0A164WWB3_DAUCS|nr:hypothetical protein DCAR_0626150 [Daucus carota subsp. sativus]